MMLSFQHSVTSDTDIPIGNISNSVRNVSNNQLGNQKGGTSSGTSFGPVGSTGSNRRSGSNGATSTQSGASSPVMDLLIEGNKHKIDDQRGQVNR